MLEDEQWCLGSKISDPRKCVFNTSLQFTEGGEEPSQVTLSLLSRYLLIYTRIFKARTAMTRCLENDVVVTAI